MSFFVLSSLTFTYLSYDNNHHYHYYYREVKERAKKAGGAEHARAAGAAIPKHQASARNTRGGTTR